jgi:hypothetical protein
MNVHCIQRKVLGERMKFRGTILTTLILSFVFCWNQAHAENGEILFGAAAITAAISPMVVSGILADSQVNQAEMRANTANQISQMNAQTALFQARTQSYMALAQAGVQRDIAAYTQQSQTRDLLTQLQFMAYNRALDNQLQQQQWAAQMQMQNSLLALEAKKMELNQILAESQRLSGELPVAQPPLSASLGGGGGSVLSPMAQTLQGSPSGTNAASEAAPNALAGSSSSLGIKRALGRSIASGSTVVNRRGTIRSDLGQMIEANPRRAVTSDGSTRRRALNRIVGSQTH